MVRRITARLSLQQEQADNQIKITAGTNLSSVV
ncbi:hypothetical protein JOC58_003740 [Paenibacillus hunanensis]|uniref:Flagellin n=1 Tax=Paenibacillus hunanensis TaxID=539262 RepID=A0ABU1J343_9BACL|nr:hypothetical protein [Paenibacillus hunanensis]